MTQASLSKPILKDLGDGLVLRRSTPDDAEALGQFNGEIHGENPQDAEGVAAWTRDLLVKPHPTFHTDDFLIIEDTTAGKIVSSLNLISQTWMYEGISFPVGRPEIVGTDPAYRNKGLVRKMFEVIHQWSCERGELVQVITGIPYFYRQFSYEMGLNLSGGRAGYEPQVPKLEEGKEEPYLVRLAVPADIPWLEKMYARECRYSMISAEWNDELWQYEIEGKSQPHVNRWVPCVIEDRTGKPVGYLVHPAIDWGGTMVATRYELDEGVSFLAVTPSVIRYLMEIGKKFTAEGKRDLNGFGFWLGESHPVYTVIPGRLPRVQKPYAYYVRVPDLAAFLQRIAPVLEKRLAASPCTGHTGELKVGFYRGGVKLVFENGKLTCAENWQPKVRDDEGNAAFPNLTFLQMVFGYRSLEEIKHAYADCWTQQDAAVLLSILFPTRPSNVWSIS